MTKAAMPLQEVTPDSIRPNPDNPRLIFREDEMNELLGSIQEVGIKVPLSVYPDGSKYTLIDGERRWRCAKKLNLRRIPVHIQPKPSPLENLLMMFNIHNVRVDWDLMPMALKLGDVRRMLIKEGKKVSPRDLAAITGVPFATVRRALDLLDLPKKYQEMLLKEAEKPRKNQRIKPDLFIEVYKSLHVIENYVPEVFEIVSKDEYVEAMVNKYINNVIDNVVSYRNLSKIARAELAGVNKKDAIPAILKLVRDANYSIEQAFSDTVQLAYDQRDLATRLHQLAENLTTYKSKKVLNEEVQIMLRAVRLHIDRLLGHEP